MTTAMYTYLTSLKIFTPYNKVTQTRTKMTSVIARLTNGYTLFKDDDVEILVPKTVRWADYCGIPLVTVSIIPSVPNTHPVTVGHKTPVNYLKKDMDQRIIERYDRSMRRAEKFINKAGEEICSLRTFMAVITPMDADYWYTKRMLEEAIIDFEIWSAKLTAVGAAINDFADSV